MLPLWNLLTAIGLLIPLLLGARQGARLGPVGSLAGMVVGALVALVLLVVALLVRRLLRPSRNADGSQSQPRAAWVIVLGFLLLSAAVLVVGYGTYQLATYGRKLASQRFVYFPKLGLPTVRLTPSQVEKKVLDLLAAGKQAEAERLVDAYAPFYRANQRVLFLQACCQRSRFWTSASTPRFEAIIRRGTNTPAGACAPQTAAPQRSAQSPLPAG